MKKMTAILLEIGDIQYLEEERVNKSKFMRQAIAAHQKGLWKYNHTSND